MSEKTGNSNGNIGAGQKIDLHTAITKLILDLKGDGTIYALAKKLGMPRKGLASLFEVYYAHLEGKEVPRSDTNPKPKPLYWKLDPLIGVADKLNIHVSDIIRAAEDVQDGLPPWFQLRIDRNGNKFARPAETFACVFLEALGCRTYGERDLLNVKGQRKSLKYSSADPEGKFKLSFSESDVIAILIFAEDVFRSDDVDMKGLVDYYRYGADGTPEGLSSKELYFILKEVIDKLFDGIEPEEITSAASLIQRLRLLGSELVSAITDTYHRHMSEKTSKSLS